MHLVPEAIHAAERPVLAAAVRVRETRGTLIGHAAALADLDAAVEVYVGAVDAERHRRDRSNAAEASYERALAEGGR